MYKPGEEVSLKGWLRIVDFRKNGDIMPISGQVDQVATSMMETEKTMNELKFVPGLDSVDEAPSLLQSEIGKPVRAKQLS